MEFLLIAVPMDCKVATRNYVLIARPSKWARKGDVVVQSPVLNITNESAIPVRRFNGDEENSVCFMPVQDIEKDGSVAYKNAMVLSKFTPIDTHGVALFRSVSDFDYQPGDRFWLFIGPERNGYEKDVPVINLRTMVVGSSANLLAVVASTSIINLGKILKFTIQRLVHAAYISMYGQFKTNG
ncbi:predicted protein [Sclerotinia sclerotiorum 1980 UF-70]|uniref:Uncharacterized protein n=1 Tax=Sclerotinia sclerotiorum (strain ATCC 18683 / 1980 / Ss-1) TaxID=665079 RepID=A7EC23_SCLS1|nr:predicted protein [Sclerotinia sclerotiorum 1980 UF-70]EDO00002.1 predicted protein [Sclerotinia sclerotiorum 1980 UF-70]